MNSQTCGNCKNLSKISRTCKITTRVRGNKNICNCGKFENDEYEGSESMTEQEWYQKYIYEESDDCELIKKSVNTGIGKPNFKDGKCEGYCHSENDDEPLDKCKSCKLCASQDLEEVFESMSESERAEWNDKANDVLARMDELIKKVN